ncbi:MAG: chorismate synthase [Bacteroidaceae bacterium]|nr:chorismate synthase [Bacteroidaceae bacterium]MBQ8936986.1 chorismate synthase [Bacteroidaceae bacterium]MBQ9190544.1 chorismate synthase [Bacteroidaceae bacterium]MBR1664823.1 chorismate synthase [Bacteroidaceae bacterium]
MNTFGNLFRLTTFGESHGNAVGGVVDGCPAGIALDLDFIQAELDRRRPGQSRLTTARKEGDRVEILSGVFEGKTTGCPIGFIVRNENQHSSDYDDLRDVFRPSHADYTYYIKYGVRDHRGGGRSSARETISRVVGGAIAKLCLRQLGVDVKAWTQQVGNIACERDWTRLDLSQIEQNDVRCPDAAAARQMEDLILEVKGEGDTIGGIIAGVITGCPVGLGEPVFGKLHAQLGAAMLSINAVKGFEYGDGFAMAEKRGSEVNDCPVLTSGNGDVPLSAGHSSEPAPSRLEGVRWGQNHSGGIQGGISNGMPIPFRVAFKPVATLLRPQETIDVHGNPVTIHPRGRHDPCVLPRAVPIVEAMAAMVVMDAYLEKRKL